MSPMHHGYILRDSASCHVHRQLRQPFAIAAREPTLDSLSNKVAIISGGATLIGRAVAIAFAPAGATAVIADINPATPAERISTVL